MSLVSPEVLPILMGANLTDKGCIPLENPLAQIGTHDLSLVPPGMFSGCNESTSELAKIKVDKQKEYVSLNFISTASIQELVGEFEVILQSSVRLLTSS